MEGPNANRLDRVQELTRYYTPLVSDVMDELGLPSGVLPREITPVLPAPRRVVAGRAFPCRVEPTDEYVEIDMILAMIDSIPPGSFVLVAATADIDAALWGGLMSTGAMNRGATAAAVNGGVRDIAQIADLDFPVFGTDRRIKDIRRRGEMSAFGVSVQIGGVTVHPGDGVIGDANGVVVVPKGSLDQILDRLGGAVDEENAVAKGLGEGKGANDLFDDHGRF